jgi:hypothetical protein
MRASFSETVVVLVILVVITIAGFRIGTNAIGHSLTHEMGGGSSMNVTQIQDNNPLNALTKLLSVGR